MSSISFSLQYDKDQQITFNVSGSLDASAYQFLHSNRRSGPFQQETVSKTVANGKLTFVIPKSVINGFGEQEYYKVTANGSLAFDGDIYVTVPRTSSEATITTDHISDATTIGKAIILAADAAAVRSLTGAGTSNLALGTTSSTAKAGNYVPTWTEITSKPSTFAPTAHTHVIADVTDNVPVTKLSSAGATTGQVLSYNGSSISWVTPSAGSSATDATTTAKGIVQLAGDLAGTADAPTVPGKASLTGATFTGAVNSTVGIAAYSSTNAGTVTIGSSATLPSIRFGNSSGPTITSTSNTGGSGGAIINATNTSATVLSVRGAGSHATNLQDWRVSTGSVLAYVDVAGKFITTSGFKLSGATTAVGQPVIATDTSGGLGFGIPVAVQKAVTANYTVVLADATSSVLHSTAGTAITITLPDDTTAIPVEATIRWRQYGAGQITFAAGTNATLVSKNNLTHSSTQYSEGRLTKVAANTWLLSGDLA